MNASPTPDIDATPPGDFADLSLIAAIAESIEAAAIAGLCREGQIEAAVAAARPLRPSWSAERLLALVRDVADGRTV